jgi:hypothetical protein
MSSPGLENLRSRSNLWRGFHQNDHGLQESSEADELPVPSQKIPVVAYQGYPAKNP